MEAYSLGFCSWDLPAAVLVILLAIVITGHNHRHKKKAEDYKEAIAGRSLPVME